MWRFAERTLYSAANTWTSADFHKLTVIALDVTVSQMKATIVVGDHQGLKSVRRAALTRLRNEAPQNGFQFHFAFDDIGWIAFEGDPVFIEPVEHAHTRQRLLHTL